MHLKTTIYMTSATSGFFHCYFSSKSLWLPPLANVLCQPSFVSRPLSAVWLMFLKGYSLVLA